MGKDKKIIVILIPGFPENEDDSTCLPLQQQLIRELQKANPGIELRVISFQYPYSNKSYYWHHIPVISFNGQNKGGIKRLFLRYKLLGKLKSLHKEYGIDGLLSFWYGECAWIGNRFAKKYQVPHYCWLQGQDARKENPYPSRVGLASSELIALSDFLRDEFEKNHHIKPQHVIESGTDPSLFKQSNVDRNIDVLGAGSLIPLKQYSLFIEIVSELRAQLPSLKATLIGGGPEEKKLKQLSANLNLQDNLSFTGMIQYQQVIEYMKQSKLFLHTSSYEGFSGVCLEALNAGCQVISFCKPMHNDITNWHIVSTKEEMIQKCISILNNPVQVPQSANVYPVSVTAKKILHLFGL